MGVRALQGVLSVIHSGAFFFDSCELGQVRGFDVRVLMMSMRGVRGYVLASAISHGEAVIIAGFVNLCRVGVGVFIILIIISDKR